MAESGITNFLDRMEDSLNEKSGADSLEEQVKESAAEAEKSAEDLDAITPAAETKSEPDPLDDLSAEANKEGATAPQAESSSDDTPAESSDGDILAEFDEADRVKIQKYLDDQIAEELKLTESAGGAFKRIKTTNRELEAKVRELENKTADPETLNAATERIAELEKQIELNEQTTAATRLEDTQAYKDAVVKPQQEILASSDTIADRYGVDRDQLANLLGNPNRRELSDKLNRLLGDDVADADKYELYDLSRKAEATFTKKNELLSNAEDALKEAEELATKEKERASLAERQDRVAAANDTIDRMKSKANFILDIMGEKVVEGYVEKNAEAPVTSLTPEDQAFARFAFDAIIPLAKKVRALENELETANDDIIKLRGATPGDKGEGGTSTSEEGVEAPVESTGVGSAVDRIGSALAGVGVPQP